MRHRPELKLQLLAKQICHTQVDSQAEEAHAMARQMVDVYAEFAVNAAAMPVIAGAAP